MTKPTIVEALNAVLAAGEAAGFWTTEPQFYDLSKFPHMAQARTVISKDGYRFRINGSQGKIHARLSDHGFDESGRGMGVQTSEVLRNVGVIPMDASASYDRDPVAIARDLNRRVVSDEKNKQIAAAMVEELERRKAYREALLTHIERMKLYGFHLAAQDSVKPETYYSVHLYKTGAGRVEVNFKGLIHLERSTTTVERMPAHLLSLEDTNNPGHRLQLLAKLMLTVSAELVDSSVDSELLKRIEGLARDMYAAGGQ